MFKKTSGVWHSYFMVLNLLYAINSVKKAKWSKFVAYVEVIWKFEIGKKFAIPVEIVRFNHLIRKRHFSKFTFGLWNCINKKMFFFCWSFKGRAHYYFCSTQVYLYECNKMKLIFLEKLCVSWQKTHTHTLIHLILYKTV